MFRSWTNLGLLIIMGFNYAAIWNSDSNFNNSCVARIKPLKRFLKILCYVYLNDNSRMPIQGENNFDRLYKVRPILYPLNKVFKELFYSSRYLSVDESIVWFKGMSSLKQYMPMKPIKRGFKIWIILCAVTAIVWEWQFMKESILGMSMKKRQLFFCNFIIK